MEVMESPSSTQPSEQMMKPAEPGHLKAQKVLQPIV
jgi:hypothetical protein